MFNETKQQKNIPISLYTHITTLIFSLHKRGRKGIEK